MLAALHLVHIIACIILHGLQGCGNRHDGLVTDLLQVCMCAEWPQPHICMTEPLCISMPHGQKGLRRVSVRSKREAAKLKLGASGNRTTSLLSWRLGQLGGLADMDLWHLAELEKGRTR